MEFLKGGKKSNLEYKLLCETMTRLKPEQRRLIGKWVKLKISINLIAKLLSCSRITVWYWKKQDLRTRFDIIIFPMGKIDVNVEATILYLRQTFKWGTGRIKQGLMSLPEFMKEEIEITLEFKCIQKFELSRQAIQDVLEKHGLNGYFKKNNKAWKFFRAKYPNELWQLDLKEFRFNGVKYYFLVLIDDYSRFLLKLFVFGHSPNISEICECIKPLADKYHLKKILTDNAPFKDSWKEWCLKNKIEALFSHPYYPQDKGKVERAIRNISEEYVYLLTQFPKWFNDECMEEWRCWFNEKRYHNGVKDYPANLYQC